MIDIKRLDDLTEKELDSLFNRFGEDFSSVMMDTVVPIVNDVRANGDKAVLEYTEKFDGIKLDTLLATKEEIKAGHANTPRDVLDAFLEAKKNIEEFHKKQLHKNIEYMTEDGATLGLMYQAIESAAMYVPGGKASYPSSVLMSVIPAMIAGTKNITLITPPNKEGKIPDVICAICCELGVDTIIKSGGAQGIAAAGFGTQTVRKSDIIVGPGNIFVTAAKTYLFSLGLIQIDSLAGPSEVLIISDGSANPRWVAWDLLSQAEHEENAVAVLVTTSREHAEQVKQEIISDIESGGGRHMYKKQSVANNGRILIVDSPEEAIAFSNQYGPEHMEFIVKDPMSYLDKIYNVGSLFLGEYAPVAVGDYYSGTNHILPTGGATRFSSGTSVDTFLRRTTYQMPSRKFLEKARKPISVMSKLEGFDDKHGGSVNIRFE